MLNNLIEKYNELVLNTKPSKTWQALRFVIHWVTLPLKLLLIGGLGTYQIITKCFVRQATLPEMPSQETKKVYFKKITDNAPILRDGELELYVNRVPLEQICDGTNQITSHQSSRQGVYSFLMNRMGAGNEKIDAALGAHMQGKWLCRGYRYDPLNDSYTYNASTTSGDMLCGLSLAMLNAKNSGLKDKFEILLGSILENDYSLLEYETPGKDEPGYAMYQRLLNDPYGAAGWQHKVSMKSSRGRWEPGLDTVGAQALTLLAALRIGDKVCKDPAAGKAYKKMLWKYGYGLLSLFPTAYIDSQRGYFNDNNCMMALYVLSQSADTKLGKLFWKLPMLYVWALSKHWYNGFYTGLVKDCYPESISEEYIKKCQAYLYQDEPRIYGWDTGSYVYEDIQPVKYNLLPEDEFSPDIAHNKRVVNHYSLPKFKTGLGFMACAIMIERNPKELL